MRVVSSNASRTASVAKFKVVILSPQLISTPHAPFRIRKIKYSDAVAVWNKVRTLSTILPQRTARMIPQFRHTDRKNHCELRVLQTTRHGIGTCGELTLGHLGNH